MTSQEHQSGNPSSDGFTYTVSNCFYWTFRVTKWSDTENEPVDSFNVTINSKDKPWCDCLGMRHAMKDREGHKHIALVRHHVKVTWEWDAERLLNEIPQYTLQMDGKRCLGITRVH